MNLLYRRRTVMHSSSSSAFIMKLLFISAAVLSQTSAFSTTPPTASITYNIIQNSKSLLDPITGIAPSSPIIPNNTDENNKKKSLVVLLPQLGEFDSSEYIEYLLAAQSALTANNINLYIVGIGDTIAASNFCKFSNLSSNDMYIDPNGSLYKELGLYAGPEFSVPDWISDDVCKFFLRQLPGGVPSEDHDEIRNVSTAWLNYMGKCMGYIQYTIYIHDMLSLSLSNIYPTVFYFLSTCCKHKKKQPCVQE